MKFYRKQPLEAEQFDGSQKLVFGYSVIPSGLIDAITEKPAYYSMLVDDVCQDSDDDTGVVLEVGDWIVKEADEIEVIADDVFKQTYAELPVIPKNVAKHIVTEHGLSDLIPIWGGIYRAMIQTVVYGYQKGDTGDWIINHSDMFARAWLDGYVVEEEK
ncbi:DUF1642 domain-containing protein [Lactiplantibacillus plantarum]|uniref:DUF1642 domain-containing protein n=1 Tax=Lactiplantibacillus plantarum TaxID=1590 RepID=UPI0007EB315F|nr:DUF1642 domain-containing protein [Lactiplantibacillus plantarum]OAZ74872.1 hypothetical protein SRCM101060_01485 [Lactiplantibacillus plantarum]PKX59555.1 hypothetical protein CUR48_05205 [Lactiplantibacillus plantarum]